MGTFKNLLKDVSPELYAELDPLVNKKHGIDILTVTAGSKRIVWWKCTRNSHKWSGPVYPRRSKTGSGCPFCSGRRATSGVNDFITLYPHLSNEWDYDKNDINPNTLTYASSKKAWWICHLGHSYESRIAKKVSGTGCPYCIGQKVLFGFNDAFSKYPLLRDEWHPAKNPFSFSDVTAGSNKRAWWICSICEHEWETAVSKRTISKRGCPSCALRNKIKVGINDLDFLNPDVLKTWDYNKNTVLPSEIGRSSDYNAWWICDLSHSFQMKVKYRVAKEGRCTYCLNQKVLVGFNDLATTHPILAAEWDYPHNAKTPQEITGGSNYRAAWICKNGHQWRTVVGNRTNLKNLNGCPHCDMGQTSKVQHAFYEELKVSIPGLEIDQRIKLPLKSKKSMSVDMISIASNVVIEYDGEYYHSGRRSGKSLQHHLDHDSAKTQALLDAGYMVVRIRENGLQHLDMTDERLIQISYKNGDLMNSVVNEISEWGTDG